MSFSDHKITQFTHKIADLPDQPNLPADELKARFDSSPEELRESVNGICDDADRLKARVEGIIAETFGDTIDKSMLSDGLAAELDAKAEAADLTAETAARESADAVLQSTTAQKCEIYTGTYNGVGTEDEMNSTKTITLGFQPKAVLVMSANWANAYYDQQWGVMALPNVSGTGLTVTSNGFQVKGWLNSTDSVCNPYRYIAFK